MYNCHDGDAPPANTPHRPGPGKATMSVRLFTSTGATSRVRQS